MEHNALLIISAAGRFERGSSEWRADVLDQTRLRPHLICKLVMPDKSVFVTILSVLIFPKHLFKTSFQTRNIAANGAPNSFQVNPKISMNYLVSHSSHIFPWNLRVLILDAGRDIFGCFSNNFQGPNNGVNSFFYLLQKSHNSGL